MDQHIYIIYVYYIYSIDICMHMQTLLYISSIIIHIFIFENIVNDFAVFFARQYGLESANDKVARTNGRVSSRKSGYRYDPKLVPWAPKNPWKNTDFGHLCKPRLWKPKPSKNVGFGGAPLGIYYFTRFLVAFLGGNCVSWQQKKQHLPLGFFRLN